MYAEFFGLRELPFNNTPDPRFFFSTPDHEEALASLIYAARERKGFVLLTGEVGAGKTLVSRLMLKHFGTTIAFANVNHAIHSASDLMESLCAEFELPFEAGSSNTQLVRTLHDFLLAKFAQNLPVVLVLDEAQNLPVEAFEQLRMIGNLEADDAKLLQIAILGQPELQTMFQSPALRQLRQRLFRSFHLPALDRKATEAYIRHRLAVAGGSGPSIFGSDAVEVVYHHSRGLPRLINTLCDNAMLSAYSADRRVIEGAFVESVAKQMMPMDIAPRATITTAPTTERLPARVESPPAAERAATPLRPATANEGAARRHPTAEAAQRNLDAAVLRAQAACERIGGMMVGAEDAVDRAMHAQQQLVHREEQIERLMQAVRSASGDLRPLLDELRESAENGRREQRSAQEIHDRLGQRIEASRGVLEEFSRAMQRWSRHEARVAERSSTLPPARTVGEASAVGRGLAGRSPSAPESPPDRGAATLERLLRGTQKSLADLRNLVGTARHEPGRQPSAELVEAVPGGETGYAPTMRLVQGMETLAELVQGPGWTGATRASG